MCPLPFHAYTHSCARVCEWVHEDGREQQKKVPPKKRSQEVRFLSPSESKQSSTRALHTSRRLLVLVREQHMARSLARALETHDILSALARSRALSPTSPSGLLRLEEGLVQLTGPCLESRMRRTEPAIYRSIVPRSGTGR